jgi:lambda repressor-like predicted transcriptional regulator
MTVRFDRPFALEPLAAEIRRRGSIKDVLPASAARSYHRAQSAGGLTVAQADSIACALGMHPNDIWGWRWWATA